ncbi:MAG: TPM domain-containing protein [Dehalococcoidia bacterium]
MACRIWVESKRQILSVWLLVAGLALLPSLVSAQDAPRLTGPITDLAGVQAPWAEAERAIRELEDNENVQLFALFVQSSGSLDIPDFTDAVVARNNLGGSDALLVIAVEDRTYQLWLGDLLLDEITETEQDELLADFLEPGLRSGDYGGALTRLASGLGEANRGELGKAPAPATTGGSGSGGGISVLWVFLVLGLVVGGVVVFLAVASRRSRRGGGPAKAVPLPGPTPELAEEASRLLLETDEAVRDARQEAAFAEAQYGPEEAAAIGKALDGASGELKAAFVAHQQLDDGTPEPPAERRQLMETVIARCKAAQAVIDAQESRLEALRDLERTAPAALAALRALIATQEARLQPLDVVLDELDRLADTVFLPVAGNLEEAEKRLAFAHAAAESGQAKLQAGERAPAAAAVRQAQEAVTAAGELLNAIERQQAAVRQAAIGYQAKRAEAQRDLAAAQAAIQRGEVRGFEAQVAECAAAIDAAERLATDAQPDAIAALAEAVRADGIADAILASVRDQETKLARARAQLAANLEVAGMSVRRAEDFLATRRDGVGREARTRLADATQALEEARRLESADPTAAAELAAKARKRADEAYDLARGDFDRWDRDLQVPSGRTAPPAFPRWPSGRSRSSGADIATQAGAVIIGEVLGGILGGGGKRGGGFGGSSWGSAAKIGGRMAGSAFGKGRSRGGRW